MTIEYEYATGDLLEDRNTYFYTAYQGADFLAAWRRSRNAALRDLPPAAPTPPPNRDGSATVDEGAATEALLETAFANLDRPGICPILDKLIQRFEVTKRIHRAYGADWRPLDPGSYRDFGLYLRFAELVEATCAKTAGLPSLNALIKAVDTLVAIRGQLRPEQGARLATIIAREHGHVDRLEAGMRK